MARNYDSLHRIARVRRDGITAHVQAARVPWIMRLPGAIPAGVVRDGADCLVAAEGGAAVPPHPAPLSIPVKARSNSTLETSYT